MTASECSQYKDSAQQMMACCTTWAHWLASADTYGADRKWVLLKPIPIELDNDEEMDGAGEGGSSA